MTSDKGLANVAVGNPKKIIKLKIGNVSKNNSTLDTGSSPNCFSRVPVLIRF